MGSLYSSKCPRGGLVKDMRGMDRSQWSGRGDRHDIVEAQRVVSGLWVKDMGYSGSKTSRYLGVGSHVTIEAASGEAPDMIKNL